MTHREMTLHAANAPKPAPMLGFGVAVIVATALMMALSACSEIDQQAKIEKTYTGKKDARAYDGEQFNGDKAKWEAAMAERSKTQNEYAKTDVK